MEVFHAAQRRDKTSGEKDMGIELARLWIRGWEVQGDKENTGPVSGNEEDNDCSDKGGREHRETKVGAHRLVDIAVPKKEAGGNLEKQFSFAVQ